MIFPFVHLIGPQESLITALKSASHYFQLGTVMVGMVGIISGVMEVVVLNLILFVKSKSQTDNDSNIHPISYPVGN